MTESSSPEQAYPGVRTRRPITEIRRAKLDPIADRLVRAGLKSDWDLALLLPVRYEDRTKIEPIGLLEPSECAQIQGTVEYVQTFPVSGGIRLLARVQDESGSISVVFLRTRTGLARKFAKGSLVRLFGEARESRTGGLEMFYPAVYAPVAGESNLPQALTAVYPVVKDIQPAWLKKRVRRAVLDLMGVEDPVPKDVLSALGLPGFYASLDYIHTPPRAADIQALAERVDPHWRRLKFDEALAQQITLKNIRRSADSDGAPRLTIDRESEKELVKSFGFELTRSQERVWNEIKADLELDKPMHRLIQGDVGCGKTVLAALAALAAVRSGRQAALMAPTEILGEQHFKKVASKLEPLGIQTVWLSGQLKTAEKAAALETISSGRAQVIIGTHAIIEERVRFHSLGLAIIDEQHRFGVKQRLALSSLMPDGLRPHLLMLSATPIPRTLAMSYLADIDVSVIDELPSGRLPVTTKLVRLDRRDAVLAVLEAVVAQGHQAYWVCPLVNESESLDIASAVKRAEELQARLPSMRIGLMHGAMTSSEKASVMEAFAKGLIDLLVATTVVEVGVDVPNAVLMIVEHAERFGLAQLHQLRGRVGRGGFSSACVLLFGSNLSESGRERLKIIRESSDGFEVARRDLELRGPGDFLGEEQSGMPMLRFCNLKTDADLIEAARGAADRMISDAPEAARKFASRWFNPSTPFPSA